MLERYSRQAMVDNWSATTRYSLMLKIELLAAQAMVQQGVVPADAVERLTKLCPTVTFNPQRIDEIERTVKHDVIAFLTHVAEQIGDDARWLHLGLTSSDVIDTALAVQLMQAADLLLQGVDALADALKTQALAHKHTFCIGRSHGMHAEPTTFGIKLAGFYTETLRNRARLLQARQEVAVCALSGPVGTFSSVTPQTEAYVAQALGLVPELVSTQVIPRDRHAAFFATLALIASSLERLAVEIRHLQRSEVAEAEEPFTAGQKGSSAMPHKRNPVASENITGLCRLVRSMAMPAFENVALWHERDISHSSVERMIAPDATITLDFALHRMAGVVRAWQIYPQNMQKNLQRSAGAVASQRILLALTQSGLSRDDAYKHTQRCAMAADSAGQTFEQVLLADADITQHITPQTIKTACDAPLHLEHIDTIFTRVFGA